MEVGGGAGGFATGFAVFRVAFDEDCLHAELAAELNVGERVTEDDAGFGGDVWEVSEGLVEEAGEGFATVALGLVVGAKVEGVDVGLLGRELAGEAGVDFMDVGGGVETEGYAALIRDYDDAKAGAIELCDSFGDAGK